MPIRAHLRLYEWLLPECRYNRLDSAEQLQSGPQGGRVLKENSLLEELLCFLVTGRSHTGKVVQFSTAFIMKVEAFFKDKFGEVLTGLCFIVPTFFQHVFFILMKPLCNADEQLALSLHLGATAVTSLEK